MRQLYKSHRTLGYEIARMRTDDGKELVILETAAHKQEVSPAHMLRPMSPEDAAFEVRVGLAHHLRFQLLELRIGNGELRQPRVGTRRPVEPRLTPRRGAGRRPAICT